jgi:phosphatidylglycerophosphatase A
MTDRSLWNLPATVIATGLGSGYSPFAPGTAGSAVGLLLWWPITMLSLPAQAGCVVLVSLVGVACAGHLARRVGLEDPGIVVVDEVAGMWLTLLGLPFTPWTAAAGFLIFRVLDVVKPFPARRLEALHGGWGIMADDLMVALYGNLLIRGGLLLWAGR